MTALLNNILGFLLAVIEEAELITLFFALVFGIVFAPINRETIVVFMAVVGAANSIHPLVAFIITATATFIGYSLGFFLARGFKKGIGDRLLQSTSQSTKKKLERSYYLLARYGTMAIIVSYFIPGARHLLPVVLGVGGISNLQFLITSKIGSIIWTAAFYLPGYFFGDAWASYFL